MNLDIRSLKYFLAVATERSFTRGAARLNMAQPPLSKRIQELEAQLGAPLFLRDSRPLVLTPAGQLMFEQAQQVVSRMDQLETTMRRSIASSNPRFVLGVVPSTLYAGLVEMIRALREAFPDLDVTLAEMDAPRQAAALRDGRINIGFDRIQIEDPELQHHVLHDEPLAVALQQDDPLLSAQGNIPLAAIAAMPVIVFPRDPRPSYADVVLSAFAQYGAVPAIVREVQEMQTALVMVAAGSGACVVPASVTALARPDIRFAPIREKATVPLLIRYRVKDQSPALAALLTIIATLAARRGWQGSAIRPN
ncbi:LysR family transcriptional regulator [Acidisoma silvae]|uniref:LysR family transcriptional regulator n=1 Tax=Acidisoma silvae TaxID=2802396 RepID=A0A963YTG1_9PROT|nr:LysR family transcriptional regulator [Acidisoma silvae]MCB8876772.1 LysR family transcriptional regulator [Acidisoma silvae]